MKKDYEFPAQTESNLKLALINSDLVGLMEREKRKLLSNEQDKELGRLKNEKREIKKKLNDLIKNQERNFQSVLPISYIPCKIKELSDLSRSSWIFTYFKFQNDF